MVGHSTNAMKSMAGTLIGSSQETTQHADGALRESNEASANVSSVATSAEELSASIAEINQQLAQTTQLVANAVNEAKVTSAEYAGLAQAAEKIGDVVKLIRNNRRPDQPAGAERHHRGGARRRAGRGFAVVANEVKSLAVRNREGDRGNRAPYPGGAGSTGGAVKAVHGIEHSMHEISTRTAGAAASVLEQNAATSEITRNAVNAARGTSTVVTALNKVSEAAIGTRVAAETVLTASNSVDASVGSLRAEIESFLNKSCGLTARRFCR